MPAIVIDLGAVRQAAGEEVASFVLEAANELVNQLKIESPVGATGDLRRSWQVFVVEDDRVVVGSPVAHARYVQEGTRPHTPPFEPIEVWARRVLGDASAAGPVWQKIKQEGTEPNPFVDRAIDNTLRRLG